MNLNSKTITISPKLIKTAPLDIKQPEERQNQIFCDEDEFLSRQLSLGLSQHLDEIHIRQIIYSYTERFLEMTKLFDASQSVHSEINPVWPNRIQGWITSRAHSIIEEVLNNLN